MTRLTLFPGSLLVALIPLLVGGCYTQVGTVRSDDDGTQYGVQDEETAVQADSATTEEQYSGTQYGSPYPYNGYGYYYPGFCVSAGWYSDPWYWGGYSYYYDPFWGPPLYAASYWPYYYYGAYATPYYNNYYPPNSYYPPYYGAGSTSHGATRTFGNSRGSGGTRGGAPVSRDPGAVSLGRVRVGSMPGWPSAPVGVSRQAPSGRPKATGVTGQPKGVESGRGSGRTTKTSKEPAPPPRPSPTNRDGTGTKRGGGEQAVSHPSTSRSTFSAPAPSSPSGGSRGRSSSSRGR